MILCAGEALIDMLPRTTTGGECGFFPCPGGSVFNTAIALARLGVRTGFFSGLSTDMFGQQLSAALRANRVDDSRVIRSDRPTTLAFVTLADGQADYTFYDENTAGRMLYPADVPDTLDGVGVLFFGGISLVVEPCADAYETLCLAQARDRVIMLDPNIRRDFIIDESRYRARLGRMMAVADIVKLSAEDLEWLAGEGPAVQTAQALLARGPKLILITEGARGVRAIGPGCRLHAPARDVGVIDTVGAGDTFNGGFLAGLSEAGVLSKPALARGLRHDALGAALELGTAAAGVTVSRAGANPPRREELGCGP
ncbi:MAG: carbohydrate kinase [Rhodobacteraceae bacterium]|nr:carbohydrate kinase [Paracoccaceae bacterium]